MQNILRLTTTSLPGGKAEIVSPEPEAGQRVDVIVLPSAPVQRRFAVDILAQGPGQRFFKTAQEDDGYVRESWDR